MALVVFLSGFRYIYPPQILQTSALTSVNMEKTGESGKEWNYTEHVATRIDPRTYDRYEAYLDQLDRNNREPVTQSEAHRRLLRAGLDELLEEDNGDTGEGEESTDNTGIPAHDMALFLAGIGAFAWLAGDPSQWVEVSTLLLGAYGVMERWVFVDAD